MGSDKGSLKVFVCIVVVFVFFTFFEILNTRKEPGVSDFWEETKTLRASATPYGGLLGIPDNFH